jgi:hypothetical protein
MHPRAKKPLPVKFRYICYVIMFSILSVAKMVSYGIKGYWLQRTLVVLSWISVFCETVHGTGGFHALSFRFSLQFGGRVLVGHAMLQGVCPYHVSLCMP